MKCPYCKSKNILEFEGDYFCQACSWDSIETTSLNKPILDFFKSHLPKKRDLVPLQSCDDGLPGVHHHPTFNPIAQCDWPTIRR